MPKAENAMKKQAKKQSLSSYLIDYLVITVAVAIFSFGIHAFTVPNNIAPGGVTGISTILHHFLPLSIGEFYAVINIPLLILGFIFLRKRTMFKTIYSVALVTLFIDYIYPNVYTYKGDGVLAGLFGGLLMGLGLGLVYSREGTTGGTDIVNRIINKFHPQLKLGQVTFFTDAVVIAAAMIAFGDINAGLYAIIAMFVQGQVIDKLVYGGYEAKMLMIFTEKYEEIAKAILEKKRGVTILTGKGAYSGEDRHVIYTVVYKNQYFTVKKIVNNIDPNAFVVITSAAEVLGQGFRELDEK